SSDQGFAFNALTSYSDLEFRKQELYYSDPLYLFDYCKKNFGKNVALLHDYNQYDFTIIVKKKFDILI
ncbi:MAG TPA: SAM-dependent methyltransferase, partial [Microscillaceae bacterium]|nr:SAM-dependent methyltransferase [Microscillaceae bacterium]